MNDSIKMNFDSFSFSFKLNAPYVLTYELLSSIIIDLYINLGLGGFVCLCDIYIFVLKKKNEITSRTFYKRKPK